LAKGDSVAYLFLEMIYDITIVIMVVSMFRSFGLKGAGFAITITGVLEYVLLLVFMRVKYGFRLSSGGVRYACLQIPLGLLAYVLVCYSSGLNYWIIGLVLFLTSTCVSFIILHRKTSLWSILADKINRRKSHRE
jgi:hypothetical protein